MCFRRACHHEKEVSGGCLRHVSTYAVAMYGHAMALRSKVLILKRPGTLSVQAEIHSRCICATNTTKNTNGPEVSEEGG